MFYTHSSLDRADHLRKEKSNLSRIRLQADSLLIPVWRGQSLTSIPDGSTQPKALVLNSIELRDHDTVFLGLNNSSHYFAVDVSAMDEPERDHLIQRAKSPGGEQIAGQFNDLRSIGPLLSQDDGSLLAYARGMIYWNSTTCYCYRCGTALQHHFHGHHKQCTNQDCGYVLFPRTDPAVIMLVIYKPLDGSAEQCLLGRSPAWPDGVYSTLAGFVETGESLEMAVRREVYEETSITTDKVEYVASQPWPFPRSIMLGFVAAATSKDISCDPIELADAQWFTKEQIQHFGSWGDTTEGYKLPRRDSIARYLIDRWLKGDGF